MPSNRKSLMHKTQAAHPEILRNRNQQTSKENNNKMPKLLQKTETTTKEAENANLHCKFCLSGAVLRDNLSQ